jgi:lysophospholipase L1-like esterase
MLRRIAANLALAVGGIVVALLLLEIGLRAVGVSHPRFHQEDPVLGMSLRPGMSGWYTKEGLAWVQINSQGFRERERSVQKPPGTLRVAVLGDSFTEALQVPIEDTFASTAERELAGCQAAAGRSVEVLNFGVSGYGAASELLLLRDRVRAYQPDVVVLAFFTGNDVSNNAPRIKEGSLYPAFILRDGALVPDDAFRRNLARPSLARGVYEVLYDYSRMLQVVQRVRLRTLLAPSVRLREEGADGEVDAAEEGLPREVYREPTDTVTRDAWLVTEALLRTMSEETRAQGARFLLMTLSNPIQVHPDPAERQRFLQQPGIEDLFYADTRLAAFGERSGFAVLTLAPTLQREAESRQVFLHGFDGTLGQGHWNAEAHHLAGRMLAQKLCTDVLHG